jgi:hypothetical protein
MKKHIKKNTLVRIMLDRYGEPYLRKLWQDMGGATKAAEHLSKEMGYWITESRFDYMAKLFGWRRKIRPDHPIALGVQYQTTKKEQYPHVIFPGDNEYEE